MAKKNKKKTKKKHKIPETMPYHS